MKILLFGKNGQVGRELQRSLAPLGELVCLGREDLDLANQDAIRECIRKHSPQFIVNAAAYTAVDKAEFEVEQASLINDVAVKTMAEEARILDSWLVHYSTDYVFDGAKATPYIEEDEAKPISVYGVSKLNGEKAITKSDCKYLILRSSWVYSVHGSNFPLAILRRSMEKDYIEVVSDVCGVPTSASLIADVTSQMIYRLSWDSRLGRVASGIYHLVASGKTTWYEYAKFLIALARSKGISVKATPNKVFPTSLSAYKAAAKRPKNSQLDNNKLFENFGLLMPNWQVGVEYFIGEISRQNNI